MTTLTGSVGASTAGAVTGFPPGVVSGGAIHAGDSLSASVRSDLQSAYASLAGQPCDSNLTGLDLGGRTVVAGVSCFAAAAALTGTVPLILDGQGNADAVFVFKIGTSLDTAAGSQVALANGAQACNVFWQVGTAAGMGAGTTLAGNLLASVTVTSGAGVADLGGGLYALDGPVTLDSNHLTACRTTPPTVTPTPTATLNPLTPSPTPVPAATDPNLGTAANFGVLGHTSVANTGLTTVSGGVGVSSAAAVAGFPPGVVTSGALHNGDTLALVAWSDLQSAYANAASQACDINLTGLDLGARTVLAGVSCFDAAAALTGTVPLTLDAQGDANAVFIFKIGDVLNTAAGSKVALANGAQACNVFWHVGTTAGMAADTFFAGNILARTSITSGARVTNQGGGLYALDGAITLDSNQVTACQAPPNTPTPTATTTSTPTPVVPTATATATPGGRSASLADLTLPSMVYSHTTAEGSGTMTLTAADATASGAGWYVTVESSDFVYAGPNGGADIPAQDFSIAFAAAPSMTAGQAVDATGGPKVPDTAATGPLHGARTVLLAAPGFGAGTYRQDLSVGLSVPGQARAGAYTGTLTVTIASNP